MTSAHVPRVPLADWSRVRMIHLSRDIEQTATSLNSGLQLKIAEDGDFLSLPQPPPPAKGARPQGMPAACFCVCSM